MLKQEKHKCCIGECDSEIKSFEEVATGICSFHRNFITRFGYFLGICWECNRITGVYEVNHRLIGILTERYLFSKGCSHCSNEPSAETSWITVSKHESNTRLAISGDGRLVRQTNKIPQKIETKEHNG